MPHPRTETSILIVDDDEFMRAVIGGTLSTLGVTQVDGVDDGRAALQWLQDSPRAPSLIISDIYMPDMDGFAFIDALAALHYRGKVLLCSGANTETLAQARERAERAGIALAGALAKPLETPVLADILDKNGL